MSEPRTGFCRGVVLLGGVLAGSACVPPAHDVVSQSSRGRIRGPAEHGRRASLDPADHLAQRRVRVEPFPPGGSLRRPPRRPDHRLVIHPPWEQPAERGYVILDVPVALEIDGTLLFRSDRSPGPSAWKVYADGRMNYYRKLPGGVAFSALALPRRGYIDLAFTIVNQSEADWTDVRALIVADLRNAAGFSSPRARHRLVGVGDDLVPMRNVGPVDTPVAAARSATGLHSIVAVWPAGVAAMSHTDSASIQARLRLGPCPPGHQVTVYGRLYFVEGSATAVYRTLAGRRVRIPVGPSG